MLICFSPHCRGKEPYYVCAYTIWSIRKDECRTARPLLLLASRLVLPRVQFFSGNPYGRAFGPGWKHLFISQEDMQILEFVSLSERHAAPKITLTPSQRKAAEGVLLGLKRGDCAVLQDLGSDGKTTVLGYVHATIVESACLALTVTSSMVGTDGLVADEAVIRRLVHSLQTLAEAGPS